MGSLALNPSIKQDLPGKGDSFGLAQAGYPESGLGGEILTANTSSSLKKEVPVAGNYSPVHESQQP